MSKIYFTLLAGVLMFSQPVFSQDNSSYSSVSGKVVSEGEVLPFATVIIKGTTIGVITNESGKYSIDNIPPGEVTIEAGTMGYKSRVKTYYANENKQAVINFNLEPDVLNLDEVVVTANRSEQKRNDAPVIVNTLSPELLNNSQSVTLGQALNFLPGLRLENNCQNCGFSQVRMNGLEGPYSQILLNSRPVFSGLAGVYGLELIPANMIEKVEVVRGGGSALYGSNAIAGTINVILKDPLGDSYEVGFNYGLTGVGLKGSGGLAPDIQATFNTSVASDGNKSGISLFGSTRDRAVFDANNDSFSEISPVKSLNLGTRLFHRFGSRDKLSIEFFTLSEERDGGNRQDYPLHERDIAEAVEHDLKTASVNFDKFFRETDLLSVYASGQYVGRNSYYGAGRSLEDYGWSTDHTYNIGAQYKSFFEKYTVVAGIENTGGFLLDKKLGYPDYDNALISDGSIEEVPHTENVIIADQVSVTSGAFIQYDLDLNRIKIALGGRYDYYSVKDYANEGSDAATGSVFSPRINLMYELTETLKARMSYSQGYRAPQVFDEDLHIESSGSRKVIHRNHPELKQETSHTLLGSLSFNGQVEGTYLSLLTEAFYTRLLDPFANEFGEPDENGTVIYTRVNADGGAMVQGVNLELKLKPSALFTLRSGFTLQQGKYDEPQEFNETRFFRSPSAYGYVNADWYLSDNTLVAVSGNYTGKMLVPYFGTTIQNGTGELRTSDRFMDIGLKLEQGIEINGATLKLFGGVNNIFNSYQSDFDEGINRDPAYIYGPLSPRTVYFGIKFGDMAF